MHQHQKSQLDVSTILHSLSDIEAKLSEYHRQDKLPPWATALANRMESIENHQITLERTIVSRPVSPMPEQKTEEGEAAVDLKTLSNDERVLAKMRFEFDTQMKTTKAQMESQISSLLMEVERLHKLLEIRPTQADVQQVQASVGDTNKAMQTFMKDVTNSVKIVVVEKVGEEMKDLMTFVKSQATSQESSIESVVQKVEKSREDLNENRMAVEAGLGSVETQMTEVKEEMKSSFSEVNDLKEKIQINTENTEKEIEEMKFLRKLEADELSRYKIDTAKQFREIEETLDKNEADKEEAGRLADDRHKSILADILRVKDDARDFKLQYDGDLEATMMQQSKLTDRMQRLEAHQSETEAFLQSIRDMGLIDIVSAHEERIQTNLDHIEGIKETITRVTERIDNLQEQKDTVEKGLNEFSQYCREQFMVIDQNTADSRNLVTRVKKVENLLENAHGKIESLDSMRDEVSLMQEMVKDEEKAIKALQTNFKRLNEMSEDHEQRIEHVIVTMERSEDDINHTMEEVRAQVFDSMTEKQAEMEAALLHVRSNIDAIVSAQEEEAQRNAQKNRQGAPATGFSVTPIARDPSVDKNSKQENNGGPDLPAISGLGMNEEEQRIVSESQAKFIADLCVSFEEIAVRKTYVPEIPPTMCEHIAATSQTLTSVIATCADTDLIQKVLRNSVYDPDVTSESINERRQQRIDEFVQVVAANVTANNASPGLTRLDAREKFVRQLRKALQMCMSKHDQVLVLGQTRFGRVKIPSCVACDRPLLDKVRQADTMTVPDERSTMSMSRYAMMGSAGSPGYSSADEAALGLGSPVSYPTIPHSKATPSQLKALRVPGGKGGTAALGSMGHRGKGSRMGARPPSSSGPAEGDASPYILRGGFKMPRNAHSAHPANHLESNSFEL
jgi:uncharacterized coiled-coil protein SlyX